MVNGSLSYALPTTYYERTMAPLSKNKYTRSVWTFRSGRKGKVGVIPSAVPVTSDACPCSRVIALKSEQVEGGAYKFSFGIGTPDMMIKTKAVLVEFPVREQERDVFGDRMKYWTSNEVGKALGQAFLNPGAFVTDWRPEPDIAKLPPSKKQKTSTPSSSVAPVKVTNSTSKHAQGSKTKGIGSAASSSSAAAASGKHAEDVAGDADLSHTSFTKRSNGRRAIEMALARIVSDYASRGVRVLDAKTSICDCGFGKGKLIAGPVHLLVNFDGQPCTAERFYSRAAGVIMDDNKALAGDEFGKKVYADLEKLCGAPRAWSEFARRVARGMPSLGSASASASASAPAKTVPVFARSSK